MEKRFQDKIAIVTGAASGIGAAIASALIAEGATVVGADINADLLAKTARTLGERCISLHADVTIEADVERMVQTATDRFGGLHAAFNVAGTARLANITDLAESDWDHTVDVCLKAMFLCIKHEARRMGAGGAIVNIASLNAEVPAHGFAAYTSAKAGAEMLSRNAALELADRGIRVNAILPGLVDTPLASFLTSNQAIMSAFMERIPIKRAARPSEIAAPALFLASDAASYVSGASLRVDGAWATTAYPDMRPWLGNTAH